jgi:hypothetical protein
MGVAADGATGIRVNTPIRTGVPRGTLARSGRWYQAARIANNLCVLILGGAGIHVGAPLSIRVTCANRFVDRRTIVRTDAVAHNASEDRSRGARIGIRDEHTFAASRANRLIREGAVGGANGRLPLCACRMVLQAKNTSGGACGDEDKSFPVFHLLPALVSNNYSRLPRSSGTGQSLLSDTIRRHPEKNN